MLIAKRLIGVVLTLLTILMVVVALRLSATGNEGQSVLDSPEASGRMLGSWIPVVLCGAIGLWCLFSKPRVLTSDGKHP